MSESKNIEESPLSGEGLPQAQPEDGRYTTQKDVNEESHSQIIHPISEIKNMEVHHHPQLEHKAKPWKEYFLEFLMIFLAVTLGFFAETIREGISENGKAKELAETLYQEVYADSVNMHKKIKMRFQKEEQMEYFRKYVSDSSLSVLSEKFYPSFAWSFILTSSLIFEPNDGILNQLKNSGAQRYFKTVQLQKDISLINVAISNARDRNAQEYNFVEHNIRTFVLQYYDFHWQDSFVQNGKISILDALSQTDYHSPVQPIIKNINEFKRNNAEGLAAYYLLIIRATRQIYYNAYLQANHNLLETLRKEYHFENE